MTGALYEYVAVIPVYRQTSSALSYRHAFGLTQTGKVPQQKFSYLSRDSQTWSCESDTASRIMWVGLRGEGRVARWVGVVRSGASEAKDFCWWWYNSEQLSGSYHLHRCAQFMMSSSKIKTARRMETPVTELLSARITMTVIIIVIPHSCNHTTLSCM